MIVWVAGYPKSGSTWLRMFLSAYRYGELDINLLGHGFEYDDAEPSMYQSVLAKPLPTASRTEALLVRDAALLRLNHVHPGRDVFVKTHNRDVIVSDRPLIPKELSKKAIYIIRDPRDIAPSYARHTNSSIDDTISRMADPNSALTDEPLVHFVGRWDDHINSWLQNPKMPIFAVRYESLLAAPGQTFREIVQFLKLELDSRKLERAMDLTHLVRLSSQEKRDGFKDKPDHMDQFFKQKASVGQGREQLTKEQVRRIEEAFSETMRQWKYKLSTEE